MPGSIKEVAACFIIRDDNGQGVACIYFEDKPGRRAAAKLPEHERRTDS
jgi:hypothetical protein